MDGSLERDRGSALVCGLFDISIEDQGRDPEDTLICAVWPPAGQQESEPRHSESNPLE